MTGPADGRVVAPIALVRLPLARCVVHASLIQSDREIFFFRTIGRINRPGQAIIHGNRKSHHIDPFSGAFNTFYDLVCAPDRIGKKGYFLWEPRRKKECAGVYLVPVYFFSSAARSSLRLIFPEMVFGKSRYEFNLPWVLVGCGCPLDVILDVRLISDSEGSYPLFRTTNALTIIPRMRSGEPTTAASCTAGCSSRALSTSNGPMRYPELLITSSSRPTNQNTLHRPW